MPRVIAGQFKGTILEAPKGDMTRPTGDKAKEALFSILQSRVPGCDFLDLFAGTGGVGIEALSRGADTVTLVEKSGSTCGVIKRNLIKIHEDGKSSVRLMKAGFESALMTLADEGKSFDIIFMDPPYRIAQKAAVEADRIITSSGLLKDGGLFIVEHSREMPFVTDVMNMKSNRSCSYGIAVITFFTK